MRFRLVRVNSYKICSYQGFIFVGGRGGLSPYRHHKMNLYMIVVGENNKYTDYV